MNTFISKLPQHLFSETSFFPLRRGCRVAVFSWALATLAISGPAAETASPAPKAEVVAPGVWRIRFGQPEQFTPTAFRSAAMDMAGLGALATNAPLPLDLKQVFCQVSGRGCSVLLPMDTQERLYGFGLNTKIFDASNPGRRIFVEPTDAPENDLGQSHAPVPFYVSTRGYGVFVDTARFASFFTGNIAPAQDAVETDASKIQTSTAELYRAREPRVKTMVVDVPAAKGVDVYVFAGPAMLDAVQRYNLFAGGGALPPLWGLGVHYRGYAPFGAADSLALAARFRADHIPCDVWGVEPGWQTRAYPCSFVWDTNKFPDPDAFLKQMREMGYRMNFWEHAFTHPASPIHDALKPWSGDYRVWGGLVPDFATPEARKIFLKQNSAALFSRGAEGVKLDECDDQPESATPWSFPAVSSFPSGLDGEQMHSLFGLLYQQTMLMPYRDQGARTWSLVRNSHALASPLPFVVYSDSYDHRCYVRGLCNEGFSGLLWTPEVRDANSVEDFYRRVETVIFSPNAVINAWFLKNPPWYQVDRERNKHDEFMPEREAMTAGIRDLLQLRMSFIPYLYTAFNEYHTTGKPPIRALVLDWPDDAKVRTIDDQFMFGDSVMVAPMFTGQKNRAVYLPAGDWYDFWTHAKLSGGKTIEATNGVQEIPLFVKGGTLLPLAAPVEYVKNDTCFDITVYSAGEHSADFNLFEDDGVSDGYVSGRQNTLRLHAGGDQHAAVRTGNYKGPERFIITGWRRF
jgi:alpha-D-xyloside xylohydrolase